jgi:hypothetical protein
MKAKVNCILQCIAELHNSCQLVALYMSQHAMGLLCAKGTQTAAIVANVMRNPFKSQKRKQKIVNKWFE